MYRFDEVAPRTTTAVLAAVAEAHPDRPFVLAEDGSLTYGAMARTCADLAARLQALGLKRGDRVGVLLPNGIRWCAATLAAHAAGLVVVPLNTWCRSAELADVLRRASLRLVLADPEKEELVQAAYLHAKGLRWTFWHRGEGLPAGLPDLSSSGPATDPLEALRAAPSREEDDALLLFTSGSAAVPKAVRLTQVGLVTTGHMVGERQGVVETDRFWVASPLFFVFGCANALPNALTHAATLCVQEHFDPHLALAFIERYHCTVYYGVAPMTRALAACDDLRRRDISSLRTGTANATPEDLRLAIEVLGVEQVCNAYGMTEAYGHSAMTSACDPAEIRMTSQGTPLPCQELRVVDDAGAPVPANEVGHLQLRGTITPGYLDDEGLNQAAFDADGWLRTGDLGRLDAQGRLQFFGRSYEMMKVKGINVSPAEIEAALVQHELVEEAFVFGLQAAEGDERVGCVVVPVRQRSGHGLLVGQLQEWVRERIADYKVPTRFWVLGAEQLPLTSTGKVSKRLLAMQVLDELSVGD